MNKKKTTFMKGKYKTLGELEAQVFMIDLNANYPLIGAIKLSNKWWVTACWDEDGEFYDPDEEHDTILTDDDEIISVANLAVRKI